VTLAIEVIVIKACSEAVGDILTNLTALVMLVCSLIIEPMVMLGFLKGGTHEEAFQRGTDSPDSAGSGDGNHGAGRLSETQYDRADVLPVAKTVRRDGCVRSAAAEDAAEGEYRAEESRGRTDAGQSHVN